MKRLSFVILHYKAKNATVSCVESVLKLDTFEFDVDIVVVENGSHDEIDKYLREKLADYDLSCLYTLVSDANLGFAKGNNLGFSFAKANLSPEYIVVANNDVVFSQTDMIIRIESCFIGEPFHILGPDIYNPAIKVHQSPGSARMPVDIGYVENLEEDFRQRLKHSYEEESVTEVRAMLLSSPIGRVLRRCKLAIRSNKSKWNQRQRGVELQGSCVIFSKLYISQMEWAFYPRTFMYLEELILLYISQIKDYIHVYDPSIQVWHMHGVSTALNYPRQIERHRFFLKENLRSIEILKNLMQGTCN